MKFKSILKIISKNLGVGIAGAIAGIIVSILYVLRIWIPMNVDEIGLSMIILAPFMIILFSILGALIGGILIIIIYNIVKLIKRKRKHS